MKKIKVLITATQKVTYKQTIEVTQEEYEIIENCEMDDVDRNDPETEDIFRILDNNIDFGNVYDGSNEYENVTVEKLSK